MNAVNQASRIQPEEMRAHCAEAAQLLRALSHPTRLMVLCLLSEGEMSVGAINQHIDLGQSALSQHLALLRRDGLVTTRRESQTIYYAIEQGPASEVLATLHEHYCAAEAA